MKSPKPGNRAQRKVDYTNYYARDNYEEELIQNIFTENYHRKLSPKIISENYQLAYQSRKKCEIHRDTGVSKKIKSFKKQVTFSAKSLLENRSHNLVSV